METNQWHLDVSEKLGMVIKGLSDLTEQVKRQNGNVSKLWEHMDAIEKHPGDCPLNGRVAKLEVTITSQEAARQAAGVERKKWHQRLHPLAVAAVTAVAVLVLQHAPDLLKFWKP